ncbi:uncharacterized protein MELLADRAFT_113615 [Melampsora larici-populina 98AG31]|uniref:Uncharacterized protein n=1 Tax=Melampsora larici-populina (strain 98AG31 / pathotype 3-4-7) TaxID=747676 RepID=F4SAH6_MELLP|nr:uncharacterized protein MELLADRAFT_113615 [Melampsora larici-populina 98AG31]EGF98355.1 hypothetical protein MELLADRAFT_113615 [Melampsora larici-populina 98AG31]
MDSVESTTVARHDDRNEQQESGEGVGYGSNRIESDAQHVHTQSCWLDLNPNRMWPGTKCQKMMDMKMVGTMMGREVGTTEVGTSRVEIDVERERYDHGDERQKEGRTEVGEKKVVDDDHENIQDIHWVEHIRSEELERGLDDPDSIELSQGWGCDLRVQWDLM